MNSCDLQITTFTVNYAGPPFATRIKDNKGLYKSLVISAGVSFALVTGAIPGLCHMLEMVPIPAALRIRILVLWVIDFAVTYSLEELLRRVFPAKLPPQKGYMAYEKELRKLRTDKKRD